MKPFIIKNEVLNEQVRNSVFLPTGKTWESTEKEGLSVWESGKDKQLFNKIIHMIEQAKNFVCLQSFLIQDTVIIDKLLAASQKGVKVFVMDSAEARLKGNREEDEHFSTKEYKEMINQKFKFNFVHRQASNFHAKFILIDPKTNPQGIMFTGNFNEKPFFENPELAIELSKSQVDELFKVFVYHFWEHATDEQTGSDQFDKIQASKKFKPPMLHQIIITSPNPKLGNLKNTLLSAINTAKKSIIFSTFGFDIKHEVSQAILTKLKEGISITIFCRPREKAVSNHIEVLAKHGAKVYCHELIHAKSLLVDNQLGYIFSANFENHGLDSSFEVGAVLSNLQKEDLLKIYHRWETTFPFEFFNEISISKIPHQFAQLKHGELQKSIVLEKEEQASSQKEVITVKELIEAINKKIEPKKSTAKKIIQQKEIRFQQLKEQNFSTAKTLMNGLELVEYTKTIKQKKQKDKIITNTLLLVKKGVKDIKGIAKFLENSDLTDYKIYIE